MSGVFQNIDPPPPHCPASVYPLAYGAGGGHTRWVERGVGANILEDARHSSVLYMCNYFVVYTFSSNKTQYNCVKTYLQAKLSPPICYISFVALMDQISTKTPNPKCRLYWCLIELIFWRYSQSCWYFPSLLCELVRL
jgi:hypothetical protein